MLNKHQKEYIYRINKVVDYIENHLCEDMSLEQLAEVAHFSPFHFHRIFSVFTGETLFNFIKRLRIEKAACLLINEPDRSVTDIAFSCGYNNVAVFCRNFKERFGQSAGEFKQQNKHHFSKMSQLMSNLSKQHSLTDEYVCDLIQKHLYHFAMKHNIEIKEMPAWQVIYCRHTGAFDQIGSAYSKLLRWAGPRGLLDSKPPIMLTYYHDDPKVTEIEKLRQSACLVVDKEVKTEGEIGKMNIPGGKYVVGHFEISTAEFQASWDTMCLWLSESGYQPADASPYELYRNDHTQHPEQKFLVDICIPVKSL